MRVVICIFACFTSAAVCLPASDSTGTSFDNGSVEQQQQQQGTICVDSDRLAFEQLYVAAGRPEVPPGACAHAMSAYRARNAAQTACVQGYARHGNGRCYRVVVRPKNGGGVVHHAYRVTYREGCQMGGLNKERKVEALDAALEALDMCDEDGGCVDAWTSDSRVVTPTRTCVAGQKPDTAGKCRSLVAVAAQPRRSPKKRGESAEEADEW